MSSASVIFNFIILSFLSELKAVSVLVSIILLFNISRNSKLNFLILVSFSVIFTWKDFEVSSGVIDSLIFPLSSSLLYPCIVLTVYLPNCNEITGKVESCKLVAIVFPAVASGISSLKINIEKPKINNRAINLYMCFTLILHFVYMHNTYSIMFLKEKNNTCGG